MLYEVITRDMVVIPENVARSIEGFSFFDPQLGQSEWRSGTRLLGRGSAQLDVVAFHPHLQRLDDGSVNPSYNFV